MIRRRNPFPCAAPQGQGVDPGTIAPGQFIDHDLTLDPTTLPTAPIDISTLNNLRSPARLPARLRPRAGARPLQRPSMMRSPAVSRRSISGQSGRNHANKPRLEQLPMRIQTTCGGEGLRRERSGKSSSFVRMTAKSHRLSVGIHHLPTPTPSATFGAL